MKKWVVLALCATLLLGLVPAWAEETPAQTVSIGFSTFTGSEEWIEKSNEVRILRESYGINVEAAQYDDEKISLMLAGGNLPDIFVIWSKYYQTVLDNHLALDLTPYLDDQLSNLKLPVYQTALELSRELLGGEERALYFLPNIIGVESANGSALYHRGYTVRWDLYKQLGCPEINSEDDYVSVLEQMVALEPATADGRKVYAMACTDESMTWWNLRGGFVRESAETNFWTFPGYLYQAGYADSELYDGYVDTDHSAFWTDMRFYNKLFNKGLFDPDSFIMTRDEYNAKARTGQYIAIGPSTAGDRYYTVVKAEDPDTLKGLMVIPSSNTVVYSNNLSLIGSLNSAAIFVNANSSNIDAALKLLNATRNPEFVMMVYNGIKGEDWDYDENGNAYLTDKWYADREKYTSNEDYIENTGNYGFFAEWTAMSPSATAPYGGFYDIKSNIENMAATQTALQKDFAETYGKTVPAEVYNEFVESGKSIDLSNSYGPLVVTAMPAIPDDIKRIMNDANDVVYRAIPQLVMAESEEEFLAVQAQVMDDLKAVDESTAWDWFKANYDAAKEIIEPLFAESRDALLGR